MFLVLSNRALHFDTRPLVYNVSTSIPLELRYSSGWEHMVVKATWQNWELGCPHGLDGISQPHEVRRALGSIPTWKP